jgi:hypothetical protein
MEFSGFLESLTERQANGEATALLQLAFRAQGAAVGDDNASAERKA